MSNPYEFTFSDMTRFFDDLKHVIQVGGFKKIFKQNGGGILDTIEDLIVKMLSLIVNLAKLAVILYVVWYLFNGYFRVMLNLLTISFFHKEDMDKFLRDKGFFLNMYRELLKRPLEPYEDPYSIFEKVYGPGAVQLYTKVKELDEDIKRGYPEFKDDDQFYNAMRDFYVYYNKIDESKIVKKKINVPKLSEEPFEIETVFYNQLLAMFINSGKYKPEKKGADEQLVDVYKMDEETGFMYRSRFLNVKAKLTSISDILATLVGQIKENSYSAYMVLPENDKDVDAFKLDMKRHVKIINTPNIYDITNKIVVNNFSWYLIEYLQYKANPNIYNDFSAQLNTDATFYNKGEINTIKKYLNVVPELKYLAENRIFCRKFDKQEVMGMPEFKFSMKARKGESYDQCSEPNKFFDFVKKRPIFSHIYFSDEVENKPELYAKVMSMYSMFSKPDADPIDLASELMKNAQHFKKLINVVTSFDLYINKQREAITKIYEDHHFPIGEFFTRLLNPYFEDFVKNRMVVHLKLTFSGKTWQRSWDDLLIKWETLGDNIKQMRNELPDKIK
jgi:hypothetical protein